MCVLCKKKFGDSTMNEKTMCVLCKKNFGDSTMNIVFNIYLTGFYFWRLVTEKHNTFYLSNRMPLYIYVYNIKAQSFF